MRGLGFGLKVQKSVLFCIIRKRVKLHREWKPWGRLEPQLFGILPYRVNRRRCDLLLPCREGARSGARGSAVPRSIRFAVHFNHKRSVLCCSCHISELCSSSSTVYSPHPPPAAGQPEMSFWEGLQSVLDASQSSSEDKSSSSESDRPCKRSRMR
jgi:hypothetical protein